MGYREGRRVEWLYDGVPGDSWRTAVQLWPEKGSKMVFAPTEPYDLPLIEYHAGTVTLLRRGLWEASDETGRSHGTAASAHEAAELLPRVQLSLAQWRRDIGKPATTP